MHTQHFEDDGIEQGQGLHFAQLWNPEVVVGARLRAAVALVVIFVVVVVDIGDIFGATVVCHTGSRRFIGSRSSRSSNSSSGISSRVF